MTQSGHSVLGMIAVQNDSRTPSLSTSHSEWLTGQTSQQDEERLGLEAVVSSRTGERP